MMNFLSVMAHFDEVPDVTAAADGSVALVQFSIGGFGENRSVTLASSDPHVLHDALTAAAIELEKAVIRFENEKQS